MRYVIFLSILGLMGCAELARLQPDPKPKATTVDESGRPAPPADARTVEEFDTTTREERVAAASPSTGGTGLGQTIATLGNAATPGFWVETPLVEGVVKGRVVNTANNRSVEVELRPAGGGSSRVSLAALRLLEAPLTELVTLDVYRF